MSSTRVERRYASNNGHEHNSVCISYTRSTPRVVTVEKGKRDVKQDPGKHQDWCKKHKKLEGY